MSHRGERDDRIPFRASICLALIILAIAVIALGVAILWPEVWR